MRSVTLSLRLQKLARPSHLVGSHLRLASSESNSHNEASKKISRGQTDDHVKQELTKPRKTQLQLDEDLRAAMEGRAGDGGLAGAELEGGKAVGLKRGVRDNMFRYI